MGAILQAREVMCTIATFPAIEGLWANAEVSACQAGILPMGVIVVRPL